MVKPLRFAVGTRSISGKRVVWKRVGRGPLVGLSFRGNIYRKPMWFQQIYRWTPIFIHAVKGYREKICKKWVCVPGGLHTLYIWMVKPVSHICRLKPQWFLDLKSWLLPHAEQYKLEFHQTIEQWTYLLAQWKLKTKTYLITQLGMEPREPTNIGISPRGETTAGKFHGKRRESMRIPLL